MPAKAIWANSAEIKAEGTAKFMTPDKPLDPGKARSKDSRFLAIRVSSCSSAIYGMKNDP